MLRTQASMLSVYVVCFKQDETPPCMVQDAEDYAERRRRRSDEATDAVERRQGTHPDLPKPTQPSLSSPKSVSILALH